MWLLQESVRTWNSASLPADLPDLLVAVAARTGQTPLQSQAETVRCILYALAVAYRRAVQQASELSGREVDVIHMVGGGVRDELLCQLTADATELPVVAGPVEGAALGIALVQARAVGVLHGDLAVPWVVGARDVELRQYVPGGGAGSFGDERWAAALRLECSSWRQGPVLRSRPAPDAGASALQREDELLDDLAAAVGEA